MKMKSIFFLLFVFAFFCVEKSFAQIDLLGKVKDKVEDKVNQKTDEAIDEGLNKLEEGIKNDNQTEEVEKKEEQEKVEQKTIKEEQKDVQQEVVKKKDDDLKSFSKYDFVPGDKVIYFEDFSQDVIGEFPALWNTNKSGEVKTTNKYPGNWFMMQDYGLFWWEKPIQLPENFTMEFDLIPLDNGEEQQAVGVSLNLLQVEEGDIYPSMGVPGKGGIELSLNTYNGQHSITGYGDGNYGMSGSYTKESGLLTRGELNHIAIWVQKTRVRLYLKNEKIFDLPRVLEAGLKLDQIRFWPPQGSCPLVSNIRIAQATGDVRSKLLTEGKIVSHGIYFDVNSDKIKPESYGSLKEIADVLTQNPNVKIKIIGHTDSDGDDKSNLDLSKRRAASVKNMLISEFKIDSSRIETDGKGESEPISDNKTKEGKANNRRVEFIKL